MPYMAAFLGIGLSADCIGAGFAAAGFACRRCVARFDLAMGIFFIPQHPALPFAIGGMPEGIFIPSCIGIPSMLGIALWFSIMPPAGIELSLSDMGGGAAVCPVVWSSCATAIAGDSRIALAKASERKDEESNAIIIDTPLE